MKIVLYFALLTVFCSVSIADAEHLSVNEVIGAYDHESKTITTCPPKVQWTTPVLPPPEIPDTVKTRIYVKGVFAGFFDDHPDDCPYTVESWRLLWFDGWQDGQNYRRQYE